MDTLVDFLTTEQQEWLLGHEAQAQVGALIRQVVEKLQNLPEEPVLALLVVAATGDLITKDEVAGQYMTENYVIAWGVPSLIQSGVIAAITRQQATPGENNA